MSLRVQLALRGSLQDFTDDVNKRVAATGRIAVEAYARRTQLALRDDTRSALGENVAKAWQVKAYDNKGGAPAALVFSKAPKIVAAFGNDTVIGRGGGLWLAIPTDNVPRGAHNTRMSPVEVEAAFNQDLIIVNSNRPGVSLAFVDVVAAKNGHGFRPVTPGRRKRAVQRVLMFILVRQVHLRKRLDWPQIFADAEQGWPDYYAAQLETALEDV